MASKTLVLLPLLSFSGLALSGLLACGDKGDDSGTGPTGTPDLVYTDANNYTYMATLEVESLDVQEGADARIDWSGLTVDLRGRTVDPATIDQVALVAFNIEKQEVLDSINDNSLAQSAIRDYRLFENEAGLTAANMSEFSILGNDFIPAEDFVVHSEATWTWAITLWDENDGRNDILSNIFIVPSPGSPNTDIAMTNDTASLSFAVDLHSAPPLVSVAGSTSYTFDWSAATTEASGQAFDSAKGDRLLIGYVAGGTVAEVEANILTVLDTADALYRMDVFGLTSADLTLATERTTGAAFSGFTTDGVWLIGVECTTCTSPVPLILSVVEVGAG